jgi:hypothetical protein
MSVKQVGTYGLKWNPNPPVTVPQVVAYALATGVYTVLAWLSILALPFIQVPGVGGLFVAVGFGVPFAMWFGGWGMLMGFIGTSVGTGILTGMPVPIAVAFGVGDIILFGSLVLIYRVLASIRWVGTSTSRSSRSSFSLSAGRTSRTSLARPTAPGCSTSPALSRRTWSGSLSLACGSATSSLLPLSPRSCSACSARWWSALA